MLSNFVCAFTLAIAMPTAPVAQGARVPRVAHVPQSGAAGARVVRDAYGVPHISAPDEAQMFELYGYAVAEDRLWQLELNRRAARGELAEILGERFVHADTLVRLSGYTQQELQAQFERLPAAHQGHFRAYLAGINRYIRDVTREAAEPGLPYEFRQLGIAPRPWEVTDVVAFGTFMLRRFGEIGGREQTNEALLAALIKRHGEQTAVDIFNDVLWTNDPGAPTTIPREAGRNPTRVPGGALGAPNPDAPGSRERGGIPASQWPGSTRRSVQEMFPSTEQALRLWSEASVPSRLGSYAWVIHADKSAEGVAMLYGGPQMGASVPEVVHEVQLQSDTGWNVTGMAFAGVPYVLIGHNNHVAWTSTTAVGDNIDLYRETLCRPAGGAARGTRYRGRCEPASMRQETIRVRDGAPIDLEVWRTVHGPAVMDFERGTAMAQKRAHWQHEVESLVGFARFDTAVDLPSFEAGVETVVTQHNFLYADIAGNIAYWQAGRVPVRPAGFDFRLPLPGDGSAEWTGKVLPTPKCVNPAQGWLANWNNKPEAGFDSADSHYFGKQSRLSDIIDRMGPGKVSWRDMHEIPMDIGRVEMVGRLTRHLKPYLMRALQARYAGETPQVRHDTGGRAAEQNAQVMAALQVVEAYDGTVVEDVLHDTRRSLGYEIFSTWIARLRGRVLGPVLGEHASLARIDVLVRALDVALSGSSTLGMHYRFIAPDRANDLMVEAFVEAVTLLHERWGADMQAWRQERGRTSLRHPLLGIVDSLPASNRATFAQVVALHPKGVQGESILTLGQSGREMSGPGGAPVPDVHFKDQLPKYQSFEYKPAKFFR